MLAALVVLAAASKAKSSNGSAYSLLIIGAIFLGLYLLVLRPRSQKMKQQRELSRKADVGDTIVTIGGLVGTIVSEEGDRLTISTGNGTELTFLRQAIGRKLEPPAADGVPEEPGFEGTPPGFDGDTTPKDDPDHSEHGTT